jgi:hypothetical protein
LAQNPAGEAELAQQAQLPVEGAHNLLTALTQIGLIQQASGGYRLSYELLGRWLRSGLVQDREVRLSDQASVEVADQAQSGETSPVMLAQLLAHRVDSQELRHLCFELGVEYENLGGEGKAAKGRELITYLRRREALPWLVEWLRTHRPDIDVVENP